MHSGTWSANRKFCMSLLRDSGFAKTAMEDHMMKEFNRLSESIGKTNGKPLDVSDYIVPCALNNIVSFFYGAQLTHDHPARHELLQLMKGVGPALFTGPQNQFLPWTMRRLLSWVPYTRNHGLANVLAKLDSFNIVPSEAVQYLLGFYADDYLVGHINLFVAAGTLGPTKIMLWQLLNFARYADTVQARVQREIDGVVGRERQPTWEDRKQMPYTMACVWEVHRWKTAQPLGPSRLCAQDVVIGDFFIPKGTTIVPNFWAVHNDPTLWEEPSTFRPERYLSEDGKMMKLKPEYLIPFSLGRRNCVGETFVTMEVFLMVTFLLQKYRIVTERPIEDDIDSPDFDLSPYSPIRLRFLPRFADIA
ncbi:hypothetical protein HPB50_018709 [Hyalomma asiaticum]|uniref:Uncharacterized protein n=1 Tax=Hyalomma asiaticum TaxID=266040 RepID=A0ACB7RYB3_HYAAI|nr:hypothetical protein HPB50_018709 [Hyalomma asiaticum]